MKTAWIYLETAILAALVASGALELWRADLKVPMYYSVGGDVHYHAALAKTMADTGWYTENPQLGAPGRMMLYDFPYAETGTFLGLKALITLVRDPFLALNLLYLSTYVLTAWAAVFVLRKFEVHDQVAVAMGLLFAFTPFHLWKGPHHIHLSAYSHVPFAVMIALWLARGDALWAVRDEAGRLRLRRVAGRSLAALAGCLLVALGGPYAAYFGCFLILVGGVVGFLRSPCAERAMDGGIAILLVIVVFGAQLIPFVIGARRQGGTSRRGTDRRGSIMNTPSGPAA